MDINKSNIELKISFREGELKFNDNARHISAFVEMSGVPEFDLLVWNKNLGKWSNGQFATDADHKYVLEAFKKWAKETNTRCQWQ